MNTQKIITYICGFVAVLTLSLSVKGQDLYTKYSPEFTAFSQFYFQPSFFNPAYIANEYSPTYWFSTRNQETANDKSTSYNATYQVGLDNQPINWAITMSYQNLRPQASVDPGITQFVAFRKFTTFQGGVQANFDFDIGEKGIGKVGLGGSMVYFDNLVGTDSTNINTQGSIRKWAPALDMGILFKYERFHLGISSMNMVEPNFQESLVNVNVNTCLLYTSPSPRD